MRLSGRLAAAAVVLDEFGRRRVPLKTVLADWARGARYAGAKDRAWISGVCLDALRRRNSLAFAMGADGGRALALATLRWVWELPMDDIAAAATERPHGIGELTEAENRRLREAPAVAADDHIRGDFPQWLTPHLRRAFAANLIAECAAMNRRADLDLRVNTLRATPELALRGLSTIDAKPSPFIHTALRVEAVSADRRAPAVDVLPAYLEGEVEIQDQGSQLVAAAAGSLSGARVLDLCAGGGGKTLALAAQMQNSGALYAWDRDARRMRDLYQRAPRAGVENLEIRNPAAGDTLEDLRGEMDLVFVDAPCTGSGVWRRQPDAKWRLHEKQLATRIREQDGVLREALGYVKAGGRLVYATCSVLVDENDDRIDALLAAKPRCQSLPALDAIAASGLVTAQGMDALQQCVTKWGLQVAPARMGCDGLYVAVIACP